MPHSVAKILAQSDLSASQSKHHPCEYEQTDIMKLMVGERRMESATLGSFPCVVYECNASLEITYVSPNAFELININGNRLIGTLGFSQDKVFNDDIDLVSDEIRSLEATRTASFIHRILDDAGLPKWVVNSLSKVSTGESEIYRGCIIPIHPDQFSRYIERSIISRFVHKIGNHFQLLTLLVNPLKKLLPNSKEIEVLEQTVEKAVDLARTFSDYTQGTVCFVECELSEVLNGIVGARRSLFLEKGISFDVSIDDSASGVYVKGDPFLLDSAIGGILQNALEATESAGKVIFGAKVEKCDHGALSVVNIVIEDSGCGIHEEDLSKIAEPFFTSKKNRDGLGLSMASRYVEIHGGVISIDSQEGKGTKVEIALPLEKSLKSIDR